MTSRARNLVALASLILGAGSGLSACSGVKASGSDVKSDKQSTGTASTQSSGTQGEGPGSEEGSADVPVSINGAYLACSYDAVVGKDGDVIRLTCSVELGTPQQAAAAWAWKVTGPKGAEQKGAVVAVDGLTAVIEIPADLLSSITLSAKPAAVTASQVEVVSSIEEAVVSAAPSPAASAQTAKAQQEQLLSCFSAKSKAATQCFADAGYTEPALVSSSTATAIQRPEGDCTPGEKEYASGSFRLVVRPGCVVTVSLWGGGGSGGGAVDGLPGGDTRLGDMVAGGGGGGEACSAGGSGGEGGDAYSESSTFADFFYGGYGDYALDSEAGEGGPGGNSGSDDDEPPRTAGEPGRPGAAPGGGGGGATGTTDCGGGGGGGALIIASFTLEELIESGASPSASGDVELAGEVGAGGGVPAENGNAGAGGNGKVKISWAPVEAPDGT